MRHSECERGPKFYLSLALVAGLWVNAEAADGAHLGFASCANSLCHGATQPFGGRPIRQSEYFTWRREDPHARAYATLKTEKAQAIAKSLGLGNPIHAESCLACHADFAGQRHPGSSFMVDEGIGCESCHGGAEKWIASHAEGSLTRAQLRSQGLYPTWEPIAKAQLCLSCHVGDASRPWSHRLMSAGHPVLGGGLEDLKAWPAHFDVDQDYRRRKPSTTRAQETSVLALVAARLYLERLAVSYSSHTLFPEASLFRCEACHHRLGTVRLGRDASMLATPAALPLTDSAHDGVNPDVGEQDAAVAAEWKHTFKALNAALGQGDAVSVHHRIETLETLIDRQLWMLR
jgi:hypothetical protein